VLVESFEELRERPLLSDALLAEPLPDEFLIAEPPPDELLVVALLPVEPDSDEPLPVLDDPLLLDPESLERLLEPDELLDDPLLEPESLDLLLEPESLDLLLELELDELLLDELLLEPESELLLVLLDCEPESLLDLLLEELELLLELLLFPFCANITELTEKNANVRAETTRRFRIQPLLAMWCLLIRLLTYSRLSRQEHCVINVWLNNRRVPMVFTYHPVDRHSPCNPVLHNTPNARFRIQDSDHGRAGVPPACLANPQRSILNLFVDRGHAGGTPALPGAARSAVV